MACKKLSLFKPIKEMLALQGMDAERFNGWEKVVSRTQMGSMVGNAMSQNILERVLRAVFVSLGAQCYPDQWS